MILISLTLLKVPDVGKAANVQLLGVKGSTYVYLAGDVLASCKVGNVTLSYATAVTTIPLTRSEYFENLIIYILG